MALLPLFLLLLPFFCPSLCSSDLPECPWVNPEKELQKWANLPVFPSKCNVTKDTPAEESGDEKEYWERGQHRWERERRKREGGGQTEGDERVRHRYYFNQWVSDKIGPTRKLDKMAHPK